MSLRQVYPDANPEASKAAKVDIVLVHGLNPKSKDDEVHALNTWTENGRLWPKDDLPKQLPDARISLYIYDSSAVYGGSQATFADKADELLETIRCDREDWEERPLILMGHSLGGILIEQALINARQNETYQHIYEATACLAFFGTPHEGGSVGMVEAGKTATKVALWLGFQKGDNIIETLDKGSMFTDILKNNFRQQFEKYRMVSFWGDKDTIVSRNSSRFGLSGGRERIIELKADHHGVAAFDKTTRGEDNLRKVTSNVRWLYKEALKLVDTIPSRLEWLKAHPSILQQTVVRESHWIVPFERNGCFTGREPELAQLKAMLFTEGQTSKIAITGLGGVGKTNLLIELVHQIRDTRKGCSIIWIPATNRESLEQAFLDAAQQLGIPGWADEKANVKRLVQNHLSKESAGEWLLVFDNADDIDMWIPRDGPEQESNHLIEFLPRSRKGSIVFTTRDRKAAVELAHQNIVEVLEMDEQMSTQLLRKYLINKDLIAKDTEALLAQLTYLPLAIVQAAAYINKNGIPLARYLSLLEEQEGEVIELLSKDFGDEGRYRNVKNPVATTWLISFEQIRHRDPLAAEYLSFMACVDSKDIPQSLLPPGLSRTKETDAIGTLDAYSFIVRRPADGSLGSLDLHRLVHLATRNWLRQKQLLVQWTERAITRLEEVFPDADHANRSVWRAYLLHVRCVLISDIIDKEGASRMKLAWRFGMCLFGDGRYDEAEVQFFEALKADRRVLGLEHPDTLASMNSLALTLRIQGRWKKAEDLQVQVMETTKRVLGEEHPSTLTSMVNLASTYRHQGRWKKAENLEVQVVETMKRVLGEEHPDTLTSMANLALTYRYQGQWKEAEDLEVQVVETRKRVLGEEHLDTLTSINNLASTYRSQGRWKEAEELEVQVMETEKRVLGEEHPNTLTSKGNLASTHKNQGRLNEAEDLQVQVVETMKRVLGEEHPDTLIMIGNLASTYKNQGRLKEAEKLEVQVMETRKRVLGEEHPNTLTSIGNLATTYENQGRLKEAEKLEVQVMETRKRVLGEEHPDTLISKGNLASTYRSQGRWKEAEELEVQVMETRKRVLGEEHPNTLASIANLAATWKGLGRPKEALKLLEDCVTLQTRVLGAGHPQTLSCSTALLKWRTGSHSQ